MLQRLSEQQRECLLHAADCNTRAQTASDSNQRQTFLDIEQRWLGLARSYEFADRVQAFLNKDQPAEIQGLTPRELQMIKLMATGLSYEEAAKLRGISPTTVHSHLKSIYRKLNVHSKTAAIYRARLLGLVP
jgi:DNA-binding CsgD family transcriptional regulator